MKRAIFILVPLMLLLIIPVSYAIITLDKMPFTYKPGTYRGGFSDHPGELCVMCHVRFSSDQSYADELPYVVENPSLKRIFTCNKQPCHYANGPTKFNPRNKNRWKIHLRICEDCHPRWNNSFETIHETHLNLSYLTVKNAKVDCKKCHLPQEYSSNIASVPPAPQEYEGDIYIRPWNGSCAYCHFTIKNASNIHDVHKPVLLEACAACHSEYIKKAPKYYARRGLEYPYKKEKEKTIKEKALEEVTPVITNETNESKIIIPPAKVEKVSPLREIYLYFESIISILRAVSLGMLKG